MAEVKRRRRTGEERKAYRDSIIKVAAQTFYELGIRDARMDDIAERAGFNKVILYRLFTSKEELIDTILEREVERLLEIDRRPFEGGKKRAIELLEAAKLDTPSFVLLLRDSRHDPVFGHHAERFRGAIFDRLVEAFVRRGMTLKLAKPSADAIVNLVLESTLYWLLNCDTNDPDEFAEWYALGSEALAASWMP